MDRVPEDDPPRAASRDPGEDDVDPYAGADLSKYPSWWRENIREFRQYGMRPYRPPQLTDGAVVPALVERMEAEYDVRIMLRAVDPRIGDDWGLYVDGEQAAKVGRERVGDGYTEYDLTAEEFETLVQDHVDRQTESG